MYDRHVDSWVRHEAAALIMYSRNKMFARFANIKSVQNINGYTAHIRWLDTVQSMSCTPVMQSAYNSMHDSNSGSYIINWPTMQFRPPAVMLKAVMLVHLRRWEF